MMSRAAAFVLLTALVGIAANTNTADASASFTPKRKMHSPVDMKRTTLVDIPRGGAGPIPPDVAAKILGGVSLSNGIGLTIAPKSFLKSYGGEGDEVGAKSLKCQRRNGLSVLASGIIAVTLLFRNDDMNFALGIASLPFVISCALALINKDSETIGPRFAGELFMLVIHSVVAYAGLSKASWANTAYKALALHAIGAGLPLIMFPETTLKGAWQMWSDDEMYLKVSGRCVGINYYTMGILTGALAIGKTPVEAFGFAALFTLPFSVFLHHFCDDMNELGMNKASLAFFTALYAIVPASILL